jgi:hypothetical protein
MLSNYLEMYLSLNTIKQYYRRNTRCIKLLRVHNPAFDSAHKDHCEIISVSGTVMCLNGSIFATNID